jgi:hypothetical protein
MPVDPAAVAALEQSVARQFAFTHAALRVSRPGELTLTLPDSLVGYDTAIAEPVDRGGTFTRTAALDSVAAFVWQHYAQAADARRLVVALEFRNDQGIVTLVRGYDAGQLRRSMLNR